MSKLHLIKLCVGVDSLDDLIAWRATNHKGRGETATRHVTRMWPKRADELLDGGSLYWVIKGEIQARQSLIGFEEVIGNDGIRRCAIMMDTALIKTTRAARRPFQGWRYLQGPDAPRDLPGNRENDDQLPSDLSRALADIGILFFDFFDFFDPEIPWGSGEGAKPFAVAMRASAAQFLTSRLTPAYPETPQDPPAHCWSDRPSGFETGWPDWNG